METFLIELNEASGEVITTTVKMFDNEQEAGQWGRQWVEGIQSAVSYTLWKFVETK